MLLKNKLVKRDLRGLTTTIFRVIPTLEELELFLTSLALSLNKPYSTKQNSLKRTFL